MNITDAKKEVILGCRLTAIFNRQKDLMAKYHDIEKGIGLMQTEDCPVNLHDRRGQARLKDFAWRATEEIAEAMECLPSIYDLKEKLINIDIDESKECMDQYLKIRNELDLAKLHMKEELIDALHFFTEFTILAGITPLEIYNTAVGEIEEDKDILEELFNNVDDSRSISEAVFAFEVSLGLCCNCLKNKAWKQTNMLTDIPKFREKVSNTWLDLISLFISCGLTPEEVADLYLKKSQVNKFRQRSNY